MKCLRINDSGHERVNKEAPLKRTREQLETRIGDVRYFFSTGLNFES